MNSHSVSVTGTPPEDYPPGLQFEVNSVIKQPLLLSTHFCSYHKIWKPKSWALIPQKDAYFLALSQKKIWLSSCYANINSMFTGHNDHHTTEFPISMYLRFLP